MEAEWRRSGGGVEAEWSKFEHKFTWFPRPSPLAIAWQTAMIKSMVSSSRIFAALGVALLLAACGTQATPKPAELPPSEQPQTRATERRGSEPPRLIAPPPAYGNKVVMAKGRLVVHRF